MRCKAIFARGYFAARLREKCCRSLPCLFGLGVALLCSTNPLSAQNQRFVYASNSQAGTISGWVDDPVRGTLTPIPGSPFNERLDPYAIAVHPNGKFLYVINKNANDVSAFSIDPDTGALTEVTASPFAAVSGSDPIALAVDASGKFLCVLNANSSETNSLYAIGSLNSYLIDQNAAALIPVSSINLDSPPENPLALLVDPATENFYVTGNNGYVASPGEVVATIQIDPASGNLSEVSYQAHFSEKAFSSAISPNGNYLYLGLGQNKGEIALNGNQGFVYSSSDTGNFPIAMAVDSTNSYLYVAFGPNSLHAFSIGANGSLTEFSDSPFEIGTAADPIVADPSGPFLYLENGGAYQISTSGSLTPVSGFSGGTGIGIYDPPTTPIQPVSGPIGTFQPPSLSFAPEAVGTSSAPDQITLWNTGSAQLIISSISIGGANSADFSQNNSCPAVLTPNASCTIAITFHASVAGSEQASLTISDNVAGGSSSAPLGGAGFSPAPAVTLVPGSVGFPSTDEGASSPSQIITVSNSGTAPLLFNSNAVTVSGPNPGDFAQTNTCSGITLVVGSSCTITISFQPQASGNRTAQVLIADDASGAPQAITLSGIVVAPFILSSNGSAPSSQTVTAGTPAQYNLQLAPAPGFVGSIAVSCTGAPPGATCTVPSTVQVNGATAVGFIVTVTTTARSTAPGMHIPRIGPEGPKWVGRVESWFLLAGLFLLSGLLWRREAFRALRRAVAGTVSTAILLLVASTLISCGGGQSAGNSSGITGSVGTPKGTSTLTVTATAGSVAELFNLTLTVQ